jgi:hypothetical protein
MMTGRFPHLALILSDKREEPVSQEKMTPVSIFSRRVAESAVFPQRKPVSTITRTAQRQACEHHLAPFVALPARCNMIIIMR